MAHCTLSSTRSNGRYPAQAPRKPCRPAPHHHGHTECRSTDMRLRESGARGTVLSTRLMERAFVTFNNWLCAVWQQSGNNRISTPLRLCTALREQFALQGFQVLWNIDTVGL